MAQILPIPPENRIIDENIRFSKIIQYFKRTLSRKTISTGLDIDLKIQMQKSIVRESELNLKQEQVNLKRLELEKLKSEVL